MKIKASVQSRVAGHFCVNAVRPDGSVRALAEFPNLITDWGLNRMASNGYLAYCHVGSGSTPPAFGDTSLDVFIAETNNKTSLTEPPSTEPKPAPIPKKEVKPLTANEIAQLGDFPQLLPSFVEVIEDSDILIYKGGSGIGVHRALRGTKLKVLGIHGDRLKVPVEEEDAHGEIRISATDLGNLVDRATLAASVEEAQQKRALTTEELLALTNNSELIPKNVKVVEACKVTIYRDGAIVRTVEAKIDQTLAVTGIRGSNLIVSAGGGTAYGEVPAAYTNLADLVDRTKLMESKGQQ